MTEQIRTYVLALFADAPRTRAAYDLREELLSNALDRYNDLTTNGMPPEDAYRNVIDGIGDVDELLQSLEEPLAISIPPDIVRIRSARLLSISIGLYIVAAIVLISSDVLFGIDDLGLIVALTISIAPTCMLVYRATAYPSHQKRSEMIAEEFLERPPTDAHTRSIRHSLSTIIWLLSLIIYFLVSFSTGAWYVTWVIFLIAPCVDSAASLLLQLRERR